MERANAAVAARRHHFKAISDDELKSRNEFTVHVRTFVNETRENFNSPESKANRERIMKTVMSSSSQRSPHVQSKSSVNESDVLIERAHQSQMQLAMREDELLVGIEESLNRVDVMSRDIGTSLKQSTDDLVEIEHATDENLTKLQIAQQKIQRLLKSRSSCWMIAVIVVLAIIAVALLFAIVY